VGLVFGVLILLFSHIIGNLVLAYGYQTPFKQITLPLLLVSGTIVTFYALAVFSLRDLEAEATLMKVVMGTVLLGLLLWSARDTARSIRHINEVLIQ